jgi:hypothetical protein
MKLSKTVVVMLFVFTLVASTMFVNVGRTQPPSANLWVSPPELTVQAGSTFSVDVVVNTSTLVSFFDVLIHFNPSAVNALGGGGGGGAYSPFIMTYYYIDNTLGIIEVRGEYAPGIAGNNIKLVHWTFICVTWISGHLDLSGSQIWDPSHNLINPIYGSGLITQTWTFKPPYTDYAPSGVPDFSQKQIGPGILWWKNPVTGKWSWCGPTAVANSLWWMDSRFETSTTPPPTINDTFPLVQSYNATGWDDHDPRNVPWLIANLSRYMDTDGCVTGTPRNGTEVHDMAQGIKNYILAHGLQDKFYVNLVAKPTFDCISLEVKACEDAILLLGYWQNQGGKWVRVGGHFVTIPGVDSKNSKIYFCDPLTDNAETGGLGSVIPPPPHNHPGNPAVPDPVHNNATFISYDMYNVTAGLSPSPGGVLGIKYNPVQSYELFNDTQQQNCPNEFESMQGSWDGSPNVFTEVEYGVFMSPSPALYWKPGYPDYAPSGMPDFDEKQDKWTKPGVSGLGNWTYCAPVAVANSLWWLDSEFEPGITPPPTKSDGFNLVTSYNKTGWDDHDPRNVPYLIQHLAYLMDTDGNRTKPCSHVGTFVNDTEVGLAQYLSWTGVNPIGDVNGDGVVNATDLAIVVAANNTKPGDANWNMAADIYPVTLGWPTPGKADNVVNQSDIDLVNANMNETGMFSERTIKAPDFNLIEKEVEKCEDVVLTIGFWIFDGANWAPENYSNPGIPPNTPKKHAVTVAGVNSTTFKIAISDPDLDAFENGLITNGRVPVLHTHTPPEPPYTTHNNASLVSQDIYNVTWISPPAPPCPAGNWTIVGYGGYGASPPAPGMYAIIENAIIMSPLGVHDVAVTNVTSDKTVIGQGFTGNITVTVQNQGYFTEKITIKTYANTTIITTITNITLARGNSATITFVWNTTGFVKGNYTISVYTKPVLGETDTADNTLTDGGVYVGVPCDVTGPTLGVPDGVCNMRDIGYICSKFMTKDPNCDVTGPTKGVPDGIVNMRDIGEACHNFMKTDP